jgi:hypothetical protein
MLYKSLLSSSRTYLDFLQRQLEMGLDAFVQLPPRPPQMVSDTYNLHGLPVSFDGRVKVSEWKEDLPGEKWPLLIKEYKTPAGSLRAEVRQDADWPYGDHVPFLDDYIETRSRKFIITCREDLQALRYLLIPPSPQEVADYQAAVQPVLDFARLHDLLVVGGWGVGADLVGWVYGLEKMIYAAYDEPQLLQELLEIIAEWNQARMRVVLETGVDLYIKRAWYENCDFWSPSSWKKSILPILKAEADLAHQYNSRLGYLITSNAMPLLDLIVESGVDAIVGVDSAKWDLAQTKARTAGQLCLWGGVNGHLTVEQGAPGDVEKEVKTALELLEPGGGFILSPVDNVRLATLRAQENVRVLISTWQAWIQGNR